MTSGGVRGRRGMDAETTQPVLEQRVRALEIASQPPRGSRSVFAGKRLHARGAKELAMHADQKRSGDPRIARVDSLVLERDGQCLSERRHDLELLRTQRLRVLEGAREGHETRAGETGTLADLKATKRDEDRLTLRSRPDRLTEHARPFGDLVEEEIFLRREVIEDGLLGEAGFRCHLGYGHVVETALNEEAHRHVSDLLPRRELLRLPQAHTKSVAFWLL